MSELEQVGRSSGARGEGGYHAALASSAKRRVLDALGRAPGPLDAHEVAAILGAHVTTARFHLEQLEAAGLVSRRAEAAKRRGRPRVLYVVAGALRDETSRGKLISVLAEALSDADGVESVAESAGAQWAETIQTDSDRDPVETLLDVLSGIGFEPDAHAELIRLNGCPFRDAAREQPRVVCSVHRGLIDRVLLGSGTDARLTPFVEPELCTVSLSRSA